MQEDDVKYDLTLCTLACTKQKKYADRLKEYVHSYGIKFLNKSLNVKFVFLVEDEERPSFLNTQHVWYNCPGLPMSMRWAKYLRDEKIDSKWVMQVDDDSSTDIDKTVELLNQFYDYEDSMILMGGRNTDLEMGQQKAIKAMNIENVFFESNDITHFDGIPYFTHAWEPSILSKAGFKKFKNWKRLNDYFEICKTIRPTFTDQTPYVVAKLAKIPIVEAPFLCPFEWAWFYSAINKKGRYSHVHYITEKWSSYNNFKNAIREGLVFNNERETRHYLSTGNHNQITINKNENFVNKKQKAIVEKIQVNVQKAIIDKDINLKLTNKLNNKNIIVVNILKDGKILIDNKDMLWQPSGKNRMSILNKKTRAKIGEIIQNAHTKEYFATLNVNGKTSATVWVGKEI